MTLAKTIRELIDIHDPVIASGRRDSKEPPAVLGDLAIGKGRVVRLTTGIIHGNLIVSDQATFDSEAPQNAAKDTLTQSCEYRQLLSVASLQFKLSQSLEYDLNVLPERISNQFNAVFNLTAQRDTQASISVAESSRRGNLNMQHIADATLRDSSSMKTVAVMTMVFLPGTFICSFFSMAMFNWNSPPTEPLVSPYIWVYFVTMVPLTLFVITVWWWKTRDRWREQEENKRERMIARGNTWEYLERQAIS